MYLHKALHQGKLAPMPEALHGMAGVQSPVLVISGDRLIIERGQNPTPTCIFHASRASGR